ncbi:hypothetical protein IWZ03DRAFT_39251 [Phyllosticta citriasiana]|uniref:Uncharacterized protein n=1 Tax=Phyllosticta citriasiana TaxID=595635 RepID=A0ABR1KDE6_9PEZI
MNPFHSSCSITIELGASSQITPSPPLPLPAPSPRGPSLKRHQKAKREKPIHPARADLPPIRILPGASASAPHHSFSRPRPHLNLNDSPSRLVSSRPFRPGNSKIRDKKFLAPATRAVSQPPPSASIRFGCASDMRWWWWWWWWWWWSDRTTAGHEGGRLVGWERCPGVGEHGGPSASCLDWRALIGRTAGRARRGLRLEQRRAQCSLTSPGWCCWRSGFAMVVFVVVVVDTVAACCLWYLAGLDALHHCRLPTSAVPAHHHHHFFFPPPAVVSVLQVLCCAFFSYRTSASSSASFHPTNTQPP